jgi:hypothetical protein
LYLVNLLEYKQLLDDEIKFLLAEGIVFDEFKERLYNNARKVYKVDLTPKSIEYYDFLFGKLLSIIGE